MQTIKSADYKFFAEYLLNLENTTEQLDIFSMSWINDTLPKMLQFTKQAAIMSKKYAVVCTNPPYMGKLEGKLKEFVIDNYRCRSNNPSFLDTLNELCHILVITHLKRVVGEIVNLSQGNISDF